MESNNNKKFVSLPGFLSKVEHRPLAGSSLRQPECVSDFSAWPTFWRKVRCGWWSWSWSWWWWWWLWLQRNLWCPRDWAKSSQVHLLCKECIVLYVLALENIYSTQRSIIIIPSGGKDWRRLGISRLLNCSDTSSAEPRMESHPSSTGKSMYMSCHVSCHTYMSYMTFSRNDLFSLSLWSSNTFCLGLAAPAEDEARRAVPQNCTTAGEDFYLAGWKVQHFLRAQSFKMVGQQRRTILWSMQVM